MMTAELETILRDKLDAAGLVPFLNQDKSQFLDMSESFFAEIVLNDGSKLAAAEQVVRGVREELRDRGIGVDTIVRAIWTVREVRYVGPARGASGGLKAASEFEVALRSGNRECLVAVEVSLSALNMIRQKLALPGMVGVPGWHKEGDVDEETLKKVVKDFVSFQLASGGESYWDPIRFPKLELNEAAASYLLPDSKAFLQLRAAIDHMLSEVAIQVLLADLASRKEHIYELHCVLPDLSNHLGGSFQRGEILATNATTLYQSLGEFERKRLGQYYKRKVDEIPENLRQGFSEVFHTRG
jgi:hypothetical protein